MTSPDTREAGGASERIKVTLTLAFDPSDLFDRVAAVGDGGSALGQRIVGAMLMNGQVSFIDALGMATYGVTLEPATQPQERL